MDKVFFDPKHYKKVTDSISITNIDHLRQVYPRVDGVTS